MLVSMRRVGAQEPELKCIAINKVLARGTGSAPCYCAGDGGIGNLSESMEPG